jgi:hypothetical protein
MKKFIIIILVLAGLYSCNEVDMFKYEAGNYLSFNEDAKKDSINVSFFFHPGVEELSIPLVLNLTGNLLDEDKEFVLSVDESSTVEKTDYILPEKLLFGANKVSDTISIVLKKTAKLDLENYKLVLRIEDNSNFKSGFKNFSYRKIYFSNIVSQPVWWDKDIITKCYLGEFSAKKYLLFYKVIGINDLTGVDLSLVRQYSLKFKRYLEENPTYEENGDLMTVSVIG